MAPRSVSLLVCLVLVAAVFPLFAQPSPVVHESMLGAARVDLIDNGKVVISMDAVGELPGVISLTLEPAASGGYTGTWAFIIAKADSTDPATGVEPPPHEHRAHADSPQTAGDPEAENLPHRDYMRLVHRGDLSGTITHAVFTQSATGADLFATLAITRGGREFDGITGNGAVTLDTLRLRF